MKNMEAPPLKDCGIRIQTGTAVVEMTNEFVDKNNSTADCWFALLIDEDCRMCESNSDYVIESYDVTLSKMSD